MAELDCIQSQRFGGGGVSRAPKVHELFADPYTGASNLFALELLTDMLNLIPPVLHSRMLDIIDPG
jgi:hypothetical protein